MAGWELKSIQFTREEELRGGGTVRLWPTGGFPRYVSTGELEMWDDFTFTAESFGRPGVRLSLRIKVIDGVPECVGVRLTSTRDTAPLTGSVVRQVDLEDWVEFACTRATRQVEEAWESLDRDPDGWATGDETPAVVAVRAAAKAVRRARRSRGSYSPETLRKVAEVYEANLGSFPTKAVRELLGGVAQSTAQLYVKKARERGFITSPAPKGGRP